MSFSFFKAWERQDVRVTVIKLNISIIKQKFDVTNIFINIFKIENMKTYKFQKWHELLLNKI